MLFTCIGRDSYSFKSRYASVLQLPPLNTPKGVVWVLIFDKYKYLLLLYNFQAAAIAQLKQVNATGQVMMYTFCMASAACVTIEL